MPCRNLLRDSAVVVSMKSGLEGRNNGNASS